MRARYFYGWNVVGATSVMALFSFGLGFYGLSVYVAMLQRLHGWSASAVSVPVTVYYVAGALLTASAGDLYQRFGPRAVVAGGSVCDGRRRRCARCRHAAVAALPGVSCHVGGMGVDERCGDQHHPRTVVPASPRPR